MISDLMNIAESARYRRAAQKGRESGNWAETRLYLALAKAAKATPDKVAFVEPDDTALSYRDLVAKVDGFARVLQEMGVGPDDRVALQIPNGSAFVIALLAANKLGAVAAVIDTSFKGVDLDHIVELATPKVAIAKQFARGFDYAKRYEEIGARHPRTRQILFAEALPQSVSSTRDARAVRSDSLSILAFSSGTESVPKAVAHTDGTWMASCLNIIERCSLTADEIMFAPAPFSHGIGLLELYCSIMLGATLVANDQWDKAQAFDRLCSNGCTFAWGPPTMLFDLVGQATAQGRTPDRLRIFQCGGANVSAALRESAENGLGCKISCIYGSTEVLAVSMTRLDDPAELRYKTEGTAVTGVDIAIWSDDGVAQPSSVVGELVSRGPSDFLGYVGNPALNEEYLDPEGWYHSGDLGVIDERGYLRLMGRKKDIVIRGGFNINVRQVEELLEGYPGLADLAVIGVPDERLGERCCMCVVLKPGATVTIPEVSDFLLSRGVDKLKVPESIAIFDTLPRTASGKVAKRLLRDQISSRGG